MNIKALLLRWLMPQPIPRRPRISAALREARLEIQRLRAQLATANNNADAANVALDGLIAEIASLRPEVQAQTAKLQTMFEAQQSV